MTSQVPEELRYRKNLHHLFVGRSDTKQRRGRKGWSTAVGQLLEILSDHTEAGSLAQGVVATTLVTIQNPKQCSRMKSPDFRPEHLRDLPAWRDLPEVVQFYFLAEALRLRGSTFAFTWNLSPARWKKALEGSAGVTSNLRNSLSHYLRKHLRRQVDFILLVEVSAVRDTDFGRVHTHGFIRIEAEECKKVRKAMRDANGVVPGSFRKFSVQTRELTPDAGWGTYLKKSFSQTRLYISRLDVPHLVATQNSIRSEARELYERTRQDVIRVIESRGR